MNDREMLSALKTLIHTSGWKALLVLLDGERDRLHQTLLNTRPIGERVYDICEMQGQVKAYEYIPALVESAIESLKEQGED